LTVVEEPATFPFADIRLGFGRAGPDVSKPKFWKIHKALPSARTRPKRDGLPPACPLKKTQNFKGPPGPPPKEGKSFCFTKVKSVEYKYGS